MKCFSNCTPSSRRWATIVATVACGGLALAGVGCGSARPTQAAPGGGFGTGDGGDAVAWRSATPSEGRRLFGAVCAGCHGANGDGKSRVAAVMVPPPRDLTRGEHRFRSTVSGALPLRTDMLRSVREGLPGTAMPAWKDRLNAQQLRSIVLYLETLSPRFANETRYPDDVIADLDAVEIPAATSEVLARGEQVYVQAKCGQCHGAKGRGDGLAAHTHRNSDGTPSHVFDFTWGIYKGGTDPKAVWRTFMTGLDGSPMPAYDQSIADPDDRKALVAYVLSLGRSRGAWFWLSERPTWREPMEAGPTP